MEYPYQMVYVKKMAKAIDQIIGEEVRNEILKDCENLTSKDKKEKRADAMREVMIKMEKLLSEEDIIRVREVCACKPQKFKKTVKLIKSNSIEMNERLKKLEDTGFAGFITKVSENTLRVEFHTKKCFCGMVGKSEKTIPLSWCHCCKEHVKWLYGQTLERDISVMLISSVIAGGKDCVFEVNIEE